MKQLSSYMVLSVNGTDRIGYTYDEIDGKTGNIVAGNKKESFFVVDESLRNHIEAIREYIRKNKLA